VDSSEHVAVGNAINLLMPDGSRPSAASTPLIMGSRQDLTYGQFVALGGDFYGAPDLTPISTGGTSTFNAAVATLASAPAAEVAGIVEVIGEEQKAVDDAKAKGLQPSAAFEALGITLSFKWNQITGGGPASEGQAGLVLHPGRYMNLVTVNMDHFGADAVKAYTIGHAVALQYAATVHGRDPSSPATRANLLKAYATNAFADHFLTDLFAAGHVRTPRRALYEISLTTAGETGLVAREMHDEDNSDGLHVSNARGHQWLAFGDGKEFDDVNIENFQLAIAAVQASADEIGQMARTGQSPSSPAALQITPRIDFSAKPAPGGPNDAPLFWADPKDYVYRRGGSAGTWQDKNNYDYQWPWSVAAMALDLATH
jgi:hypothetical protein